MTQSFIHMHCNAVSKIRREKRDGRETLILQSYAAKADSVLNGMLYPRDELEASINGLDRTPAPMGHPSLNGKFVPALDPEALARNHVFAWNENPRWDGDRIALDVVIDAGRAAESPEGNRLLTAINAGKPISTSTGLLARRDAAINETHDSVARDIYWDHVAILMDEKPAIGPESGVGIFVNSSRGDGEEIEVVNSAMEDAERELDWAVDSVIRAAERLDRVPLLDKLKSAILAVIRGGQSAEMVNDKQETAEMAVTEDEFNALSQEVKSLKDSITEAVANAVATAIKPIADQTEAMVNAAKAKDDAELDGLRAEIVKANLMDEAAAGELTLNAARALAPKAKPGRAYALNGAMPDGKAPDFDLPE